MTNQSLTDTRAAPQHGGGLMDVVGGGYCIGCGACAAAENSPIKMAMDEFGRYVAKVESVPVEVRDELSVVCPFADASVNEDVIGRDLYADTCEHDGKLGYYHDLYAGHVAEGEFRSRGSSGGMATWVLAELFARGLIDGAIHVRPAEGRGQGHPLYEIRVSRSADEIWDRAKSSYYPIEMSKALAQVRDLPGRYALVGIPCFIKAARLLTRRDTTMRDRIAFTISLVCGHLKSAHYADFLAWQAEIAPGDLEAIDFRRKVPQMRANDYGLAFYGEDQGDQPVERQVLGRDIYGASWGYGFFMYSACEFCDDVMGETADITVGDAWLQPYIDDWKGSNVVVVRDPRLVTLVNDGIAQGRLVLDRLTVPQTISTQAGCYRQRRDALAYRMLLRDRAGVWRPRKRVVPGENHLTPREKAKYGMRAKLMAASHVIFNKAVEAGSFTVVRKGLAPLIRQYDRVDRPAWRRFLSFGKRTAKRLLKAVGLL